MGHSMKHQMLNAIEQSFRPGESKRTADEIKRSETVYSFQYRENLRDIASDFSKFMKDNYKDVKLLKDIAPVHVEAYLKEKDKTVSSATLTAYKSGLEKIGKCASNVYRTRINLKSDYQAAPKEKIRDIAMKQEDYKALMKATESRPCQSRLAVELARVFGLRVCEVVKITPRDIKGNVLHIHESKGGRSRDLKIKTEEQRAVIEKLNQLETSKSKPYIQVKEDSVNKWLGDNLKKIGITVYNEAKTGVHAVRKMYAEERYQENREKGMDHKKAWGEVSVELGHSEDRESLFRTYCPTLAK